MEIWVADVAPEEKSGGHSSLPETCETDTISVIKIQWGGNVKIDTLCVQC